MIKTYEALLASALLIGTLALISSPFFISEKKYSNLREAGENAFLSFCEKEEFRGLAAATEDEESLNELKDYTDTYMEFPYSLRVCDRGSGSCLGNVPEGKAYTAVSYLFDGNISEHDMKRIQLFVWVFEA